MKFISLCTNFYQREALSSVVGEDENLMFISWSGSSKAGRMENFFACEEKYKWKIIEERFFLYFLLF